MNTNNFSKECFYDALISLCENSDYKDINVKEICKKAGFNRSTFYRHYTSKEDIVIQKVKDLIANWHSSINFDLGYVFENFVKLFEYFRNNCDVFKIMHKMNLNVEMLRMSFEYMYQNYDVYEYDKVFVSNGILAVVFNWIDKGMNESNEYMANLLSKYLQFDLIMDKNNKE